MSKKVFQKESAWEYNLKLCHALKEKDFEKAKQILTTEGSPKVNSIIVEGDIPLNLAINNDAGIEIVKLLLKKGADVNSEDEDGDLPLILAIEKKNAELALLILDSGADLYVKDMGGSTALHKSAALGMTPVVEALLKRDLFPDVQDSSRRTALHWAAKEGHERVVKCLLARGASLEETDRHGRTPLHLAAMSGHYEISCRLIDYGGDINRRDNNGRTCLHDSSWLGHIDVVRLLLNCNIEINVTDHEGFTALHHAATRGHDDIVLLLLDWGGDLSVQDKAGRTPLHHVMLRGHNDTIRMMIECSDDLNTPDHSNRTPIGYILCGMPSTTAFKLEKDYELCELIVKHAVRAKVIGKLEISTEDFTGLETHLSERRWTDVCSFFEACQEEILDIKQYEYQTDSISLYDFLTKPAKTLVKYAQNEDFANLLDSDKWVAEFPIYADFIKARISRAMTRRDWLILSTRCLSSIVNRFLPHVKQFPDPPCYQILKSLTDLDLKIFIKACYRSPD